MDMEMKEYAALIVECLEKIIPTAKCSLEYNEPYQLMIATRLSAQCTDDRVNKVTRVLFEKYPTLESYADADVADLEAIIRPCGLVHSKAESIIGMCQAIRDKYKGIVPDNMEELLALPGVGRKSANLILGDVYHQPAIVADTHCIRVAMRLRLVDSKKPEIVEKELKQLIPPEKTSDFCHRLVLFGREFCTSRSAKCGVCPLAQMIEGLHCDH